MMGATKRTAILALADGTVFSGRAFGAETEATGELVFHTASTGYQEILSEPGAAGRIYVFAYPEIGNAGVHEEDRESDRIHAAGVIVRHLAEAPSSHLSQRTLEEELSAFGIPGLQGIDTRMLIRRLRDGGSQMAVLSTRADADPDELVRRAAEARPIQAEVGTTRSYEVPAVGESRHHVVAYDFGIRRSLLRRLAEKGCKVTVVPSSTSAADCLSLSPDGILLSGGPGDPSAASAAIGVVRELLGKAPILGIGFGHQLLAQAVGAKTVRLKMGHFGNNHPVKDLASGKVAITSHAHSWTVDEKSLEGTGAKVSHASVDDGCVEGIELPSQAAIGLQFHPESSPGPHDALGHFDRFASMMEVARQAGAR